MVELFDSRRLTGPNFYCQRPSALVDVLLGDAEEHADELVGEWRAWAQRMQTALGWTGYGTWDKRVGMARDGGVAAGLSLALEAPIDVLYAACSVNEWALDSALRSLGLAQVTEQDADGDFEAARARLLAEAEAERNPALIALSDAAHARGVTLLWDDDEVSLGQGTSAKVWPARELPAPDAVDWDGFHDVPTALVTGTNGKSTTVRLLCAMASAAGHVPGSSSTDYVRVGDEVLDAGDWSGPGGGRMLLRDRRVTLGVLEVARGGMLRRGLAVEHADVAVILNVGADHLAEWGTPDLASMAEAKFIPTRAGRALVLNADDPHVTATYDRLFAGCSAADLPAVHWFALDPANERIGAARAAGGSGAVFANGALARFQGAALVELAPAADVPMTLDGAARYNIANALAAVAAAHALGLPDAALASGLRAFGSDPADNPGRLNRFELGGATVLVDFAHNPDGFDALFEAAAALPAERRLVLLGQSGDRERASTRGMARACVAAGFDHVVIKELTEHLRGRALGELPAEVEAELRAAGLPESRFEHAPNELEAVEAALRWAQPGDLLLLLAHDARDAVLARIAALDAAGWRAGTALPTASD